MAPRDAFRSIDILPHCDYHRRSRHLRRAWKRVTRGGILAKKRSSSMTDKELVRRLFSKGVRREMKTLLLQQDSGKRSKKDSEADAQSDAKSDSKKESRKRGRNSKNGN